MAGVWIEQGGYLREILLLLGAESWDCWWLITDLECYDTCGWPGAEKWGRQCLLLTQEEFFRDVGQRDMQMVWGLVSAIPSRYSREEILAHPLPSLHTASGEWAYGAVILTPQHPLAILDLACEDASSVTAVAWDGALLRPLSGLSGWTEDAENLNRRFQAMAAIAGRLTAERGYGAMNAHTRRNLLYTLWHALYHHMPEREVDGGEVEEVFQGLWQGPEESFCRAAGERERYLPLLLLGDESEMLVRSYLNACQLYLWQIDGKTAAVCAAAEEPDGTVEILNLAVAPAFRRRGIGRALLKAVCACYPGRGAKLGTGEVPGTLAFYRSCGFSVAGRVPDYFTTHYDHPIVEEGVVLRDQIIMCREADRDGA